jgi:hypothetical protein
VEEKIREIPDLPDFDEWAANWKPPVITYLAAFDKESGQVLCVGPDYSIDTTRFKNTIEIDKENALAILEGEVPLSKCFIDVQSGSLEITEVQNLFKIDDVLHRVIDIKWADIDEPDVIVSRKGDKFTVQLSEKFGGTYKLNRDEPVAKRKIFWDGETILSFDICEYNDPHTSYYTASVKLDDIVGKAFEFTCECPDDASVFTRRLFKNYVFEEV